MKKCDKSIYRRILDKIQGLSKNPFPTDCKRVINKEGKLFRIRVGNYRIIYEVFNNKNAIVISNINKRNQIYNK